MEKPGEEPILLARLLTALLGEDVGLGDDADHPLVHDDRNAGDAVPDEQRSHVGQRRLGCHRHDRRRHQLVDPFGGPVALGFDAPGHGPRHVERGDHSDRVIRALRDDEDMRHPVGGHQLGRGTDRGVRRDRDHVGARGAAGRTGRHVLHGRAATRSWSEITPQRRVSSSVTSPSPTTQ